MQIHIIFTLPTPLALSRFWLSGEYKKNIVFIPSHREKILLHFRNARNEVPQVYLTVQIVEFFYRHLIARLRVASLNYAAAS